MSLLFSFEKFLLPLLLKVFCAFVFTCVEILKNEPFIAQPLKGWIRPDTTLRFFSIGSLVLIAIFVLNFHRSPIALFITVLSILVAILIEQYYYVYFPDKTHTEDGVLDL